MGGGLVSQEVQSRLCQADSDVFFSSEFRKGKGESTFNPPSLSGESPY